MITDKINDNHDSREQDVQGTFNSIAPNYDFMNSLMSLGMDNSWRRKAVRTVKAAAGMKMLDLCCGTGKLTLALSKAVGETGKVVGVDFSEKMLNEAWKNLDHEPSKDNIKLLQADAMNLPFEDNSYDGATVGWGLRNLPDLRRGITEMQRVVKPGSMVVSLDMGKPSMPVYKQLYWLYFQKVIPFYGKLSGGKQKEYNYLYHSACEFESQIELAQIFNDCGLINTGYINLAGGVVAVVYGQKP